MPFLLEEIDMRAEIQQAVAATEKSLALLRRHL
jgi:hypothetical protein